MAEGSREQGNSVFFFRKLGILYYSLTARPFRSQDPHASPGVCKNRSTDKILKPMISAGTKEALISYGKKTLYALLLLLLLSPGVYFGVRSLGRRDKAIQVASAPSVTPAVSPSISNPLPTPVPSPPEEIRREEAATEKPKDMIVVIPGEKPSPSPKLTQRPSGVLPPTPGPSLSSRARIADSHEPEPLRLDASKSLDDERSLEVLRHPSLAHFVKQGKGIEATMLPLWGVKELIEPWTKRGKAANKGQVLLEDFLNNRSVLDPLGAPKVSFDEEFAGRVYRALEVAYLMGRLERYLLTDDEVRRLELSPDAPASQNKGKKGKGGSVCLCDLFPTWPPCLK